jgi:hypothetical protein
MSTAASGVLDLGQYFMAELWTRQELKFFPILLKQPLAEEAKLLDYNKLEASSPPKTSLLWLLEGLKKQQNHLLLSDYDCMRPSFPVLHDLRYYPAAYSNSSWGTTNIGIYMFDVRFPRPQWIHDWRHDLILVSSEWTRQWLLNLGIRSRRLHVIRPGVDVSVFHPDTQAGGTAEVKVRDGLLQSGGKRRFVVYSSNRLSLENGQDLVVAAFAALVKAHDGSSTSGPPPLLLVDWHTDGAIACFEAAHGSKAAAGANEHVSALQECFREGVHSSFDAVAAEEAEMAAAEANGGEDGGGGESGASGDGDSFGDVSADAASDSAHLLDAESLRAYYTKVGALELLLYQHSSLHILLSSLSPHRPPPPPPSHSPPSQGRCVGAAAWRRCGSCAGEVAAGER